MRNFHQKKQVERQRLRKECVAIAEQIRATEQDIVHVRADLADHADELTFAQGEKSEILSKLEVSAALFFFGGEGTVLSEEYDTIMWLFVWFVRLVFLEWRKTPANYCIINVIKVGLRALSTAVFFLFFHRRCRGQNCVCVWYTIC